MKRTSRRSASSGNVLDVTPGLSQRLSQAADPSLFRVPSESAVQQEATPAPAPPAPTGGLAEALKSAQLRKTPKVCILFFGLFKLGNQQLLIPLLPLSERRRYCDARHLYVCVCVCVCVCRAATARHISLVGEGMHCILCSLDSTSVTCYTRLAKNQSRSRLLKSGPASKGFSLFSPLCPSP